MRSLLCLALLATPALADEAVQHETIAVGQVIERDAGYAIGVVCDGDVVEASMFTRGSSNVVTFRGLREGTTVCRVGTDPTRVTFLYEITVVKRTAKR